MSVKEMHICDGCGEILKRTSDRYKLSLRTDRFWNSVEMDYFEKNLDFCERCAENIKESLKKIAQNKNYCT